jgi:prephenate dehydratase
MTTASHFPGREMRDAAHYDPRILARFIEDMAANWTHFMVVSRPD